MSLRAAGTPPGARRVVAFPHVCAEGVIGLMMVGALALIWLQASHAIGRSRSDAENAGIRSAQTMAMETALEWEKTTRRITEIQRIARLVSRAMLEAPPTVTARIAELDRASVQTDHTIVQVAATDPAGMVLWSTRGLTVPGLNLSAREHIQAIVAGGDRFIGRPVVGAVSGRRTIQFSEAFRDIDQTLRGITVVSIDAAIAEHWADDMHAGSHMTLSIIRDDGTILARSDSWLVGSTLPARSPVFQRALATDQASGHVPDALSAVSRYTAIRRIAGSSILVEVSLDDNELQTQMRRAIDDIALSYSALGVAAVALAGLSLAVIRRQRALARIRGQRGRLEQRDSLLRQIGAHAADVICLVDETDRCIFVSNAVRQVLGHDPKIVLGQDLGLLLMPDDRSTLYAGLSEVRARGEPWRAVMRVSLRDATLRWIEIELVAIEQATGAVERDGNILAVIRDVTRNMDDSLALRATTEQLEAAFQLGLGLMYTLTWDEAGTQQVHYPSETIGLNLGRAFSPPGHRIISIMAPLDTEAAALAIVECRKAGLAAVEYQIQPAGHAEVWVRNEMRLADPSGTTIIGFLTNITAERAMRLRLHAAERLSMLGEIASGIAHEIIQPLAAIALAAQNGARILLREPANVAAALAKFERIDEQAIRLASVVEHIQTVGRGDRAPVSEFRIDDLIADSLKLCASRLTDSQVAVTLELAADLRPLRGQRIMLEQVLMNLIVNACDAYDMRPPPSDTDRPRGVWITARHDADATVISVRDLAGGIPPEVITRIFDPFFTTKGPGKGVGLGLSISFTTIADMGGVLSARNVAGGAVMVIHLPRTELSTGHVAGDVFA